MRIVMMGTGPFAVPTFTALVDSPHEVAALITRPVPPARGRTKAPANPMRDEAERQDLPVHAPANINSPEGIELLKSCSGDLLVVCDYGQILSSEALSQARLGGINLHASLLPAYRGSAPINWAIFHGEVQTGISVIHMTPRLDGGPILATRVVEIGQRETTEQLEPRLAEIGVAAVMESVELLSAWDGEATIGKVQDATLVTKAPRLKKTDANVDWNRSAIEIVRQVRAFQPWPGTCTWWYGGKSPIRLIIDSAVALDQQSDAAPGEVVACEGRLDVQTGYGVLAIEQVKPAGKRSMTAEQFLRGNAVTVGDQLGANDR